MKEENPNFIISCFTGHVQSIQNVRTTDLKGHHVITKDIRLHNVSIATDFFSSYLSGCLDFYKFQPGCFIVGLFIKNRVFGQL